MKLSAADVAEIMKLVEQSTFDELLLEVDGLKLTLRRGAAGSAMGGEPGHRIESTAEMPVTSKATATPTTAAGTQKSAPTAAAPAIAPPAAGEVDVVAALLGTAYRAPKPGASPFVEVGSRVEEDSVIAIIEVMKLMNSVRAGVRGEVVAIHFRDGVLVEHGEAIVRVRLAG
jgi:acetyl-CoA carboxylase biotin carboxyl carrier protein